MKKTLIAAGIAAVVAAPAAFADVQVSGVVENGFINTDSTTASADEWNSTADNSITFKASEGLGNGMTAFASVTLDVDKADAVSNTGRYTKDEVVGIKGGFGTVVIGRMEDFTEGKLMSRMTLEGDGGAGGGAIENGDAQSNAARQNDGVAYVSPTMAGFHFGVAGYTLDNGTATNTSDTFDATDVALFYDNGPLSLAVSRETWDRGANDQKVTVATASYKIGNFKATVLRHDVDNDSGTTTSDSTDMLYRVDFSMGKNALSVAMNDNELIADGSDGGNLWAVEASHSFSPRTKVYATMVDGDTDKSGINDTFTLGLKHKF